jgi:Protein of unknown function (DUF2764)
MKNFYYYLVASLPMLQFGMKPPFSYPGFLEACSSELNQDDRDILANISITLWESDSYSDVLKEWKKFDRSLKNELVRTRAVKRGKDPNKYLCGSDSPDPFIAPLAHWATNQDSPMEAELYLDKIRWGKIEEIKTGHYFDMECLVAYGLQLRILERWDRINSGDSMNILERLAGKI